MLREVQNVRQIAGEPFRRWFASDWFDIIVWYDGQEISGFQLCYDKHNKERALTWKKHGAWHHLGVDDGEGRDMHHKSSPILVADGSFDPEPVLERLMAESLEMPGDLIGFISRHLRTLK